MKIIKQFAFLALALGISTVSFAEEFVVNYPYNSSTMYTINIKVTCTPPSGSSITYTNFPTIAESPAPSYLFYITSQSTTDSNGNYTCPANSKVTVKYSSGGYSGSCPTVTLSSDANAYQAFEIAYNGPSVNPPLLCEFQPTGG